MQDKDFVREFNELKDPCLPVKNPVGKWDIYSQNQYNPQVKVTNWWYHREGCPKDNNDVVKATYKRWGTYPEDESHWVTETKDSMRLGRGDNKPKERIERKPPQLLTFMSYPLTLKPRKDLLPDEIRKILPTLPKDQLTLRYTTTNQSHYKKVHIIPK